MFRLAISRRKLAAVCQKHLRLFYDRLMDGLAACFSS